MFKQLPVYTKDFFWWLLKENYAANFIYRNHLGKIFKNFTPYQISTQNLPIIDKADLMSRAESERRNSHFFIKGYTSGTTNSPMTVYRSYKSVILEEYIVKTHLKAQDVPVRPKIAVLRGDKVCDPDIKSAPYWRKMPFTKRLMMSSFHLSEHTFGDYLAELERYKPDVIMAYPSTITPLAKMAQSIGWQPSWDLKCVFTSSETFTVENQQLVKSVFGSVFDHYGQAERVATLQQCRYGNYHVRDDYSIVEFVEDEHGTKIVGSNVHNSAMPLLRYDTKDYVEGLRTDGGCACGNPAPFVTRILGRNDDYVILADGRRIGRLDVAFKGLNGLIECQIEQRLSDELIIRYVPHQNTNLVKLETAMEKGLRSRLGSLVNLKFEATEEIPRTASGKFRSVIRTGGL
ncbi:hypothetical protein [Vibrio sp. WXL103]|uniref:hypothetical protein n=1 Tax=unclassified Vibrio TaxID=2614977 RepID=UPI003EC59A29